MDAIWERRRNDECNFLTIAAVVTIRERRNEKFDFLSQEGVNSLPISVLQRTRVTWLPSLSFNFSLKRWARPTHNKHYKHCKALSCLPQRDANVNAAKREFRNALFSSQKPKVFYCQLSQRFRRRHRLLSAKGEFVRKLLEVKIMKTWVGRPFTQLKPKIGNAQSLFFEWKQNFLKRDQNATTWKRGPVLAKRSGSTLLKVKSSSAIAFWECNKFFNLTGFFIGNFVFLSTIIFVFQVFPSLLLRSR